VTGEAHGVRHHVGARLHQDRIAAPDMIARPQLGEGSPAGGVGAPDFTNPAIVEAVLLLGFAIPLWRERTDTFKLVVQNDHVRVRVVGWQFGWTYHYPGTDGKFGRIDPFAMSSTNELGIDYTDPNAADDFTSPILKLPKGIPAILNIGSKDVIHNYSIVPMRIQQDAIPGKEIPMWFTPIKTLETSVVCGQLCGEGHGNMIGSLEVIEAAEYKTWEKGLSDAALKANQPKAPVASR
jgi:cytochrome c oxidase subunit 2